MEKPPSKTETKETLKWEDPPFRQALAIELQRKK